MTATEAARNFSEVLNRVAAGEEFELTRSGAPVATIGRPKAQLVSAERFREVIAGARSSNISSGRCEGSRSPNRSRACTRRCGRNSPSAAR